MENAAVGNMRNIAFWVVLFLLIVALFQLFSNDPATMSARDSSYSDFVQQVENDQVTSVTIDGEKVFYRLDDGTRRQTVQPQGADLTTLPFLLLIGVWIYFMNRMQGAAAAGRWALASRRRSC
jgi:cell division protease FtsH